MHKRQFFKTGLAGIALFTLAKKVKALEYYPKSSAKKWAIVYATWCGSSRDAAVWISEGMDGIADVFDVRENPKLAAYDHIVIGSSIRSFKMHPDLQAFIQKNQGLLKEKTRGLFAVCGNRMQAVTDKQRTDYLEKDLAETIGIEKVPGEVFLGRVTYGLLDEEAHKMLKGFDMPEYDNLKREACMALGKQIKESTK